MKRILLGLIAVYQGVLSPLLPGACRFTPTCSAYAAEAIRRHGCARGLRLAAGRLLRCRPGGGGGEDPVPAPAPRPGTDPRAPQARRTGAA